MKFKDQTSKCARHVQNKGGHEEGDAFERGRGKASAYRVFLAVSGGKCVLEGLFISVTRLYLQSRSRALRVSIAYLPGLKVNKKQKEKDSSANYLLLVLNEQCSFNFLFFYLLLLEILDVT